MTEDRTALQPTAENVARVADCIRDGGVAVIPGDTNMTFAVDPENEAAVERVYELKGRDRDSPLSVLQHDPTEWRRFGRTPHDDLYDDLVEAFLPGPLNVIVERTDEVPAHVVSGFETVCLGSFRNETWRAVTSQVSPIAATSANISGAVDDGLVDLSTALDHVGAGADCVLAGEGLAWTTQSTTIVDLSDEPTVFREGDVSRAELNEVRDVF